MAKNGKKKGLAEPGRIINRKARFDYQIGRTLECGIRLVGTEVKQLRVGQAQMADAFARIEHGKLLLQGVHIDPYPHASEQANHDPRRLRTLLAHKREIRQLEAETRERGVTLVPLEIYFKDGRAKVELGVGRGKRAADKRESIKKKDAEREMRRAERQRY
ncbi:MAG: SsrA-binding protein SmpB [Planctomycetota bacterium]